MKINTITLCKIIFYMIASIVLLMIYVDKNNILSETRERNEENEKTVRGPQGPPGPPGPPAQPIAPEPPKIPSIKIQQEAPPTRTPPVVAEFMQSSPSFKLPEPFQI